MKFPIVKISELVRGQLRGDASLVIEDAAGLEEAGPKDISFVKDEKNMSLFKHTNAGATIVPKGTTSNGKTTIEVENPLLAFSLVLQKIAEARTFTPKGIHPTAYISPKAIIGKNVSVGPQCSVEDEAVLEDHVILMGNNYIGHQSKIGTATKIYPQVVIRERVQIGSNCIIHSGTVIGSDGFGYFFGNGKHNKIPQIGNVVIEDEVEIGSCSTIDRATTGTTRIGRGSKIDNLVQVAHNVKVGPGSILVAQVGIAGSTTLEEGVILGGQVGVADHTYVGKGTQVGAQSGIKGHIKPGSILFGSPAQPIKDTLKQLALFKKLPKLFEDVKKLKDNK